MTSAAYIIDNYSQKQQIIYCKALRFYLIMIHVSAITAIMKQTPYKNNQRKCVLVRTVLDVDRYG